MAPLSGLSKAWVAASAALPHGWSIRGVARGPREVDPQIHGESWVAWARPDEDRPELPPSVEGQGESADQAVNALANALRELDGVSRKASR